MSKGNRLMLLLLLACAASPAHATFSVGYRGIGVLSNAGSSGIVAAIHPNQSAWGLALSVNGTTLDSKTLILDSKSVTAEKNNIR